jgi:hypothetical protein
MAINYTNFTRDEKQKKDKKRKDLSRINQIFYLGVFTKPFTITIRHFTRQGLGDAVRD